MGHTCRGHLLALAREEEEHAGEAADALKPQQGLEWVRHDVAYLLVVETTTGRQGFAGDEEAVAEEFREVVVEPPRGTEMLGRVGGKLPGVEGISLVGRGTQEPSGSRRSIGAPRRRCLGRSREPGLCELHWAARGSLVVVLKLPGCAGVPGRPIYRPATDEPTRAHR